MKTSELEGLALDWAVAKCEVPCSKDTPDGEAAYEVPAYSTDWALGGPIIERVGVSMVREWAIDGHQWWCSTKNKPAPSGFGKDQLIAAMRCYVASKLGDEVKIPE